jgi:hypothetical protein
MMNPDMPWNEEIRTSWARMERLAASPGPRPHAAADDGDGRARGTSDIRAPTLVLHHADDPFVPPAQGKLSQIRYPERSTSSCLGATSPLRRTDGARPSRRSPSSSPASGRRGRRSSARHGVVHRHRGFDAPGRGDGGSDWHALLDAHDAVVRAQLARFRGREVNTSGDGFLAMFDGPQRAIRCAMAIRDACRLWVSRCGRVAHRRVRGPRR